MGDKRDIHYAGPTGREMPGEHWNARIIREENEAASRQEGSDGAHDIQTNGTGYYWCSCSPNHARGFAGLREHIADVTAPRPVIDREAAKQSIYTTYGQGDWERSGRIVDAVMELARPMPTREQVAAVLRDHLWIPSEHRCSCGDEEIEFVSHHQAEAVLSLLAGSAT